MPALIRNIIDDDVFDSDCLNQALSRKSHIHITVTQLLGNGEIIRIKRGLYTFSSNYRKNPLELCSLANRIYGPSYVSAEFALSYYGLIPETVRWVTSITDRFSRNYKTPFGCFEYIHRKGLYSPTSFSIHTVGQHNFKIAYPEKAIYDKVATDYRFDGRFVDMYLEDDLRIDHSDLESLNIDRLRELHSTSKGRLKALTSYLIEINK